jgi:phosphate-selective porin OprO/OprP
VVADGTRLRWSPQGQWFAGRVGASFEYVESSQEVRLGSDRLGHELRAWQVTVSALLTDDAATARGVSPKRPFDPALGSWGALRLDARWEGLTVEESAFPVFADPATSVSAAEGWGAGVTWTLSRHVKLVLDFVRTRFKGGAANGDREPENAILARTQHAF